MSGASPPTSTLILAAVPQQKPGATITITGQLELNLKWTDGQGNSGTTESSPLTLTFTHPGYATPGTYPGISVTDPVSGATATTNPIVVVAPPVQSPQGFEIYPGGTTQLYDASLEAYTITTGGQIEVN